MSVRKNFADRTLPRWCLGRELPLFGVPQNKGNENFRVHHVVREASIGPMMIGTHSLLPVCGCLLADKFSMANGRPRMFSGRNLCVVGLFGFLPDILSPHLSLESRQVSLSHTVWFLAGLVLLLPLTRFIAERRSRLPMALACWLAYALHLAADAISGGIAWLYPWRDDAIGRYWIEPQYWIWYDAGFIVLVWFIYRVMPQLTPREISGDHS